MIAIRDPNNQYDLCSGDCENGTGIHSLWSRDHLDKVTFKNKKLEGKGVQVTLNFYNEGIFEEGKLVEGIANCFQPYISERACDYFFKEEYLGNPKIKMIRKKNKITFCI